VIKRKRTRHKLGMGKNLEVEFPGLCPMRRVNSLKIGVAGNSVEFLWTSRKTVSNILLHKPAWRGKQKMHIK
jgi:hypothetical protein